MNTFQMYLQTSVSPHEPLCALFESVMREYLGPRNLRDLERERDTFSLTETERARISAIFAEFQGLATKEPDDIRSELRKLSLPRVAARRDLAAFLLTVIT
jgi:hypothetical protein